MDIITNNMIRQPSGSLAFHRWIEIIERLFSQPSNQDQILAILMMIIDHKGSAPREKGCWQIITQNHSYGTLGGGEFEYRAGLRAKTLLNNWESPDHNQSILEDFLLGPDLGQCCGGAVRLMYHRIDGKSLNWVKEARLYQTGFVAFDLQNLTIDPRYFADDDQTTDINQSLYHLQSITNHTLPLYVLGAGHVAQAIAWTASCLPISVNIWDERTQIMDNLPILPQNVSIRCLNMLAHLHEIPSGAAVVIMTHNHQLDFDLGQALLLRDDLSYLGIIGSKTKTARFRKNFYENGISQDRLQNLFMPLAPNAPRGKEPGVIALGILHELLKIVSK